MSHVFRLAKTRWTISPCIARRPHDQLHTRRQLTAAHSRAYRGQRVAVSNRQSRWPAFHGATVLSTNRVRTTRRYGLASTSEPNASGIASVFPVVELGARLTMTHLDGTGVENLVVNATALPHAFARVPRFRPPQHGSWTLHRSCLGWAAPCPSGTCGEFERPSRSANDQVAAETARRTCQASDWRPDKRLRTSHSAECGYAPSLFPPSARCSGGTCGSAGRQGGFSKWNGSPAVPQCGQAKPSPQRAFSR